MHSWIYISRLLIAGYLILSGLKHANDLMGYSYQLEEFFIAADLALFQSTKGIQAGICSFLELFLGGLILIGQKPKASIKFASLFFLIGMIANSMILFHSLKIHSFQTWITISLDFTLLVLSFRLLQKHTDINQVFSGKWSKVVFAANLIFSLIIPAYSYNSLPFIDFSSYSVGIDLRAKFDQAPQQFQIYDIDQKNVTSQVLSYSGHQLFLVIEQIESCHFNALPEFNKLAEVAEKNGIPFYGLTSNKPSTIEDFRHEVQAAYPFLIADQQILRSMIRSNPGLILLKGSTILGKWHFNSVPTFEDLNSEFKLKSGGPSLIQ